MPQQNNKLQRAKNTKNDEFYTLYENIEKEISFYKEELKGKVIYLTCDSEESNFWKYLKNNFKEYELKSLIATHYEKDSISYKLEYDGKEINKTPLKGDGNFESEECVNILKTADVVITNPPFSKWRMFFDLIKEKKFLIVSPITALTYKDVFPYIKEKYIFQGASERKNNNMSFSTPNGEIRKVPSIWMTNIKYVKTDTWELTKTYNEKDYPKIDGTNIINIDRSKDVPIDYYWDMAVPVTFLSKIDYDKFEIISSLRPIIQGKQIFKRIVIRRKRV